MRRCVSLLLPLLAGLLGNIIISGGSSGGGGGFASTIAPATSQATTIVPSTKTSTSATTIPMGPRVVATGTIRALTYNVAGLPQWLSSQKPSVNIPKISPLLNNYDLVLVQEDFAYHAELERDAKHTFRTPPLPVFTTVLNDGLNAFSKWPLTSLTRTTWADCNGYWDRRRDCLAPKGFFHAQLEIQPGVVIDVLNFHADAGGSADDIGAREKEFRQLADAILNVPPSRAVIVCGDTNLNPLKRSRDNATLENFMKLTGLMDVARTLGQKESPDRFFFRGTPNLELQPLRWRAASEFVDAAGQSLSDHQAIHVDFEWRLVK